jgi:hypothetical protein
MSHLYKTAHQTEIQHLLQKLNLPLYYSKPVMNQLVHFVEGFLAHGFSGTLTDIHRESCHSRNRRTLSHFLTHGKWDEHHLLHVVQESAWKAIHQEAKRIQEPIFVIVDDTVCEKTKPSSQAMFSMQGTGFHHSHTKGKRVWGHERVEQILRCGDVIFPYQFQRYESKQESKIQIACNLLKKVPTCSLPKYLLIDSWYPAQILLETALQTGNHVISGLKTNRIIYPYGIRQSIKDFAKHVRKEETNLVTVGHSSYYVYRYEGKLNVIENAIVLLCWEAETPMTSENMRAFLSTDVGLSNKQIMQYYSKRWAVETYFRTMKVNLSLDRYQVRSTKALDRLWTLLNCSATICMLIEKTSLIVSIHQWQKKTKNSWIEFIYTSAKAGESLDMIQKQLQAA